MARDSMGQRWPLSPFHVRELYRCGFAPSGLDYAVPLWRRHNTEGEYPLLTPAAAIEPAMLQFASAFDRSLLAGIDPIIRAALGYYSLMRIQPFGRHDRDVAELLFHVLLREAGLPPMPTLLMFYRLYWEHAHIVLAVLASGQPDELVDAMIAVVAQALVTGRDMIDRLTHERRILLDTLPPAEFAPDAAETAVRTLLSSTLIGRRDHPAVPPSNAPSVERQALHLHAAGLIDLVEAGGKTWWSSRVVRGLVGY